MSPKHNAMVDTMLQSQCHIITTLRMKAAWEVVEMDKGRKAPRKIGLKPKQKRGWNTSSPWFSTCQWKGMWPQPASTGRLCLTVSTSCPLLKQVGSFWNGSRLGLTLWKKVSGCFWSSRPTWISFEQPMHLTNWWKKHEPEFSRSYLCKRTRTVFEVNNQKFSQ